MRIYTGTTQGRLQGVAACSVVVVANDKGHAKRLIKKLLKHEGMFYEDGPAFGGSMEMLGLEEVDPNKPLACLIHDGEF